MNDCFYSVIALSPSIFHAFWSQHTNPKMTDKYLQKIIDNNEHATRQCVHAIFQYTNYLNGKTKKSCFEANIF